MTMGIVLKTIIIISRVDVLRQLLSTKVSINVNSRITFFITKIRCATKIFKNLGEGDFISVHE